MIESAASVRALLAIETILQLFLLGFHSAVLIWKSTFCSQEMLQQNFTDTLHLKNSGHFFIEISLGPGPNLMIVNRDNCIGFHQFDINQTNKTYKGGFC